MKFPEIPYHHISRIEVSDLYGHCYLRDANNLDRNYPPRHGLCKNIECHDCGYFYKNSKVQEVKDRLFISNQSNKSMTITIPEGYKLCQELTSDSKIVLIKKTPKLSELVSETVISYLEALSSKQVLYYLLSVLAEGYNDPNWSKKEHTGYFIGYSESSKDFGIYYHNVVDYGLPYFQRKADAQHALDSVLEYKGRDYLLNALHNG